MLDMSLIKNHIINLNSDIVHPDLEPNFLALIDSHLQAIIKCNDYSLWQPLAELAQKVTQIKPKSDHLQASIKKIQNSFWGFIFRQPDQFQVQQLIFNHICQGFFSKKVAPYIPAALVCKKWYNLCLTLFLEREAVLTAHQQQLNLKFNSTDEAINYFIQHNSSAINLSHFKDLTVEHLKRLFSENKNIKYLYIDESIITELPEDCSKLTLLSCRNSRHLQKLPTEMPYLVSLDCSGCSLFSLPGKMKHLKYLFCHGNQLRTLPADMIALKKIKCSNNPLAEIPSSLINLKILNCANLAALSSLSAQFTFLKELWCGNCPQLTEIPYYPALKTLSCYSCSLVSLPDNMVNLEWLNCSHNQLKYLPEGMFALKQLFCRNNPISVIPASATHLETLDCANPQLFFLYCRNRTRKIE